MEELVTAARALNIDINSDQTQQFERLYAELILWNAHTNLTAITDKHEVIVKHFLDSLTVLAAIPSSAQRLIDIGSGAGFPGLPIKILRPELEVTLLEATGKKIEFIDHTIKTLALPITHTVQGRAEEAARDPQLREQFDVATARAVAELNTLAEYALPFVKIGGVFIAQKNKNQEELEKSRAALETLGGVVRNTIVVMFPELEERQIIVIEKIKETPSEYPRRIGVPSRKPL